MTVHFSAFLPIISWSSGCQTSYTCPEMLIETNLTVKIALLLKK